MISKPNYIFFYLLHFYKDILHLKLIKNKNLIIIKEFTLRLYTNSYFE